MSHQASFGATTIPLASPLLARSSNRPGSFGRAVLKRFPIWSCSVRGFACHRPYGRRGALLPHLFTLTLLRRLNAKVFGACSELRRGRPRELHPTPSAGTRRTLNGVARPRPRAGPLRTISRARRRAVYFLCHFPSGYPDRALPGALPCGVRTFLPPPSPAGTSLRTLPPASADDGRLGSLRWSILMRWRPAGRRRESAVCSFQLQLTQDARPHWRRGHRASADACLGRSLGSCRRLAGRSIRRFPGRSGTARASCRGCCGGCRSLRRSWRCSSRSRAACRQGRTARCCP